MEVLREWVIQETEFRKKAKIIQGLSRKHDIRSNTREIAHTFWGGKQNQGTGSVPPTKY